MNILRALEDEQVFAPFFRGETWGAWRVFLAALFALPLTAEELATYQRHTGWRRPTGAALTRSLAGVRQAQWQVLCLGCRRGLPCGVPRLASVSRTRRARHDHGDRC